MANSTICMSYHCMKVSWQMAFLAGIGIVVVGLGCSGGRGASSTFLVAGKTFSSKAGIMPLDQITGPGAGKGMTNNAVGRFHIPCLWGTVMAFSAITVSDPRM